MKAYLKVGKNNKLSKMNKGCILSYGFFLALFTMFSLISCGSKNAFQQEYQNGKKELNTILSSFIGKTPNQLYELLDKPDEYLVKMDKKNKITSAEISYNYVYNFDTKKFDCKITFITDKQQRVIHDYIYSSDICIQMTMY